MNDCVKGRLAFKISTDAVLVQILMCPILLAVIEQTLNRKTYRKQKGSVGLLSGSMNEMVQSYFQHNQTIHRLNSNTECHDILTQNFENWTCVCVE